MQKVFITFVSVLLFSFTTNLVAAPLVPWHVVDTYIETVKTFSSTSKPGSKSITFLSLSLLIICLFLQNL